MVKRVIYLYSTDDIAKSKVISKNLRNRKQSEGEIIHNPIVSDKNTGFNTSPTEEEMIVEMPKTGYEVKSFSGNTRDLSKADYFIERDDTAELKTVGILSAVAIALHNIPEGIVTYIGYVDNPVVGLSLAIGIAAHNIPEGLSIALPIFYATGSRNKAFLWALLAGLAEPCGAIICSLLLHGEMNVPVFGFLYGCVAGIMIYICIYELIPTGVTLDCENNYTCGSFIVGVFFIIITLCMV